MYLNGVEKPCNGCAPKRRGMFGLGAAADPSSGGGGFSQEILGSACPQGMQATAAARRDVSGNYSIMCKPIPAPKPVKQAPAPAPIYNYSPITTISPNVQTGVTTAVNPVFQQSSGSGDQGATTTQTAPAGQSGAGGSGPGGTSTGQGISAQELSQMLSDQAATRAAADQLARQDAAAAQAALFAQMKEQNDKALLAYETASKNQQQVFVPSGGGGSVIIPDAAPAPLPMPISAEVQSKKPIKVYIIGGVMLLVVAGAAYAVSKKRRKTGKS